MIIHLQEIQVSIAKENYKYGLLEQVTFEANTRDDPKVLIVAL